MTPPTSARNLRAAPPGRVAMTLVTVSLAVYWCAAVAGPSAVSHELRGGGWLPPYRLDARPSPWLVVALLWCATVSGAAGTWLALRALQRGWRPKPLLLLMIGAIATVAFVLVPPVNSDDVYSYAAYGRMASTGANPYTTRPIDLIGDPVADSVTPPWRDVPSVYGPLATAEQSLVMSVAGDSVHVGVLGLSALGALAFLAVAGILHRYAADDDARRRAAVCWAANPLLVFHLVGGAHLDALGVVAVLAAVVLLARRKFGPAGATLGAAIAVKLTGGVAALGLAWSLRRDPKRLSTLLIGGVLVVVPLYLLAGGLTAMRQVRAASRFVSHASWWRPITVRLDASYGTDVSRDITSMLALLAFGAMTWLLWAGLPRAAPGLPVVARAALAPTLAWLLTATYTLPWYAAWAWPLLALIVASRWDHVLLAWTAVLTIGYIPGRDVALPPGLAGITRWLRAGFAPMALGALLVVAVAIAARNRSVEPPAQ